MTLRPGPHAGPVASDQHLMPRHNPGHGKQTDNMKTKTIKARLKYLRGELRAERISYGELAELQDMASRGEIPPDDVELLEAAGVPENKTDEESK